MSNPNTNRHGRHKDGNVLLGSMVDPERKAIAIVTAAMVAGSGKPLTVSDLIWIGISRIAEQYGVLDGDGRVTERFRDAVEIAKATVIHNNRTNRGGRGKRGAV